MTSMIWEYHHVLGTPYGKASNNPMEGIQDWRRVKGIEDEAH